MAIYAIGDIQGCLDELQTLIWKLRFDPSRDRLWFTGDLVNRGPKSLKTLRFIKNLGKAATIVLGNHDLNLLAVAYSKRRIKPQDTLTEVLKAPDRDELLQWIRHWPLLHHDPALGYTMIHAGLPPQWNLLQAQQLARETETILRGDTFIELLHEMYGDQPDCWSDNLSGHARHRFIINCFTRMRFCTADGRLNLNIKGAPGSQPEGYHPWFSLANRRSENLKIIFGHWSTLGLTPHPGIYALDTGCVWGGKLTAIQLDTPNTPYTQIDCNPHTTLTPITVSISEHLA